MKKIYSLLLIGLLIGVLNPIKAQTVYLQEGFENAGKIPTGWTQVKKLGNALWDFYNGGALPPGSSDGLPPAAHTGSYNARFFKSSFTNHETYLISPEFSFEFAQKPELRFWYAQVEDQLPGSDPDNTKFKVFWRSPEAGNTWYQLKYYTEPTVDWVYDAIPIPDSVSNKKYKKVQLCFLGISTTVGYGSCIDDVLLVETDTVIKYIEKVYATQPITDIIPSGSINNPILRLRFPVQGNDGDLFLDSLVVTGLEKAAEVVASNGVKIFHTTTEYFTNTNPIGTSSFVNGKAVFDNINHELPFGNSYVWVTYDIPEDTEHKFKNILVDAKVEPNSIKVSSSYFPVADLSPNGNRKINESVFFDDFETNKSWTLTGEFQWGVPEGIGGFYQNPDPDYAQSGLKVLGTDLTGLGDKPGDYELGILQNEYIAKTVDFNCTYYKELNLQYYRWLNVNFTDTAGIDYSTDNGSTWTRIWTNNSLIAENQWRFQQLSLSNLLDRNPNIQLRFTLGPTNESQSLSGWNIDNFALTGSYVNSDVGISALLNPKNGCGHDAPEAVEVTVKNSGFDPTTNKIPVGYSLNEGVSWVYDTVHTTIPKDGSVNFSFSQLVDFTDPGYHTLSVSTFLSDDEDARNNRIDTIIYVAPTYTVPYSHNFETSNGFWKSEGTNTTWEHGTPRGNVINKAYSGSKCWATNLDGSYPDNDSAWIESPCFDFTGIDKPIVDFMLWANAEPDKDGLSLYYTINDGVEWKIVPTFGSYLWNWYNNPNIEALNHAGWDSVPNKWFKARQVLPNEIANVAQVKFRFLLMSNDTIASEGFAIDNFMLYNAPTDAGISAIVDPKNSCSLSKNQDITVAIKNYGIRPITDKDSLFATVIINETTTLKDTFITATPIAVNGTANFTFSDKVNMFAKKWYKMNAYTTVNGDTSYYVAGFSNNAKIDSAYVKGEPYYALAPDIGTLNADTVILDGKVQSVGGANFTEYKWIYIGRPDSTVTIADNRYFGVPSFPDMIDYLTFSITVKNDSGCYMKDTIQIIKSTTDIGITSIAGITDKCIDNQNQLLSVDIKNFTASYTMPTGTNVKVGYKLGEEENEDAYIETFPLAADLLPGNTVNYMFSVQPEYTKDGNQNLSVFTVVNADLDYSNDTMMALLEVFPLPEVDLGADSILTMNADTLVLDAGPNAAIYLWQDGSSNQTFSVPIDLTATYAVTITDNQSCGNAIDSVLVISNNWVLDSLISPVNICSPSANESVTVVLINNSPNDYSAGFSIASQIIFNDSVINEPIILASPLAAFETVNYTYNAVLDMSMVKEYAVFVKINPTHDFNRLDNELNEFINVWGVKETELGPNEIITHRADTILLNAGSNFETYNWQDGSTNSTYQIVDQSSASYWVSVTDFNNCPSSVDTVRIIAMDLTMDEIISPEIACDIEALNTITFALKNSGPDMINFGENITVSYKVNNDAPKSQDISVTSDFFPNETRQFTLTSDFNFISGQTYQFTLYLDWDRDNFKENDTLRTVVYELEHPVVELGPDINTTIADTVVLRVQPGYTNYKWQDGSRADTLAVEQKHTANYWVKVISSNGCTETDSLTIYTYDIGIIDVMGDENDCNTSINKPIQLGVTVIGADTLKVGQQVNLAYQSNGISSSGTFDITENVTAADTAYFLMAAPLVINSTGNFNFAAQVSMDKEVDVTNNSYSSVVHIGTQAVDLGPDVNSYEPSVTLDAGSSFIEYLWNDNSQDQTLVVISDGNYSVTTTDFYGCNDADSVNVHFLIPKFDVFQINGLADSCERKNTSSFSFILKNNGNSTIPADSTIEIKYQVNVESEVVDHYTFTNTFTPGQELEIPFETPADLMEPNEYNITVSVTVRNYTSALDTTVNTWGLPDVDLGDNIATTSDNATLDAGTGFKSYLWNTGETTQTITVTSDGQYWVKVTSNQDCENSDTINVTFVPASLSVNQFLNPTMGCERLLNEEVSIVVQNTGGKVIPAGSNLIIGYKFDNMGQVNELVELANDFNPNANAPYKFITKLSKNESGTYPILFTVNMDSKEIASDTYTITIYGKPVFFEGNDTIKATGYPYVLDPKVTAETYSWSTGANTETITVTADGNYSVTITQDNTCEFNGTVHVTTINSVSEEWRQNVSIYPNPADNAIFIKVMEPTQSISLHITDLQGRLIFDAEDATSITEIDIATWPQGVYILTLFYGDKQGVYQIIKN